MRVGCASNDDRTGAAPFPFQIGLKNVQGIFGHERSIHRHRFPIATAQHDANVPRPMVMQVLRIVLHQIVQINRKESVAWDQVPTVHRRRAVGRNNEVGFAFPEQEFTYQDQSKAFTP